MTWARLDDGLWRNRKIRRLWHQCPQAVGLHLLALSYCADQLTDGVVDREFVADQLAHFGRGNGRETVTKALRNCGLWRENPDGFEIKDWLEYNPSRDDVLAERAANAERQADWRARRHAASNAVTDAVTSGVTNSAPYPYPALKKESSKERKSDSRRIGGPSHDDANAAGKAWAARKRERKDAE